MIKRPGMNIIQIACWGGGGGGVTPGISWWWCARGSPNPDPVSEQKKCHFHNRFQTWPLKSIPVWSQNIALHVCTEINYIIIAEIKIATKRLLKIPRQNPFRFRIFHPLIYLELKRPNTLIHNRNSFVNHTQFNGSKWAKSITVLRPKRHKNSTLWGGTYQYGLYKGVPPVLTALGNRCNSSDPLRER